MSARSQRRSCLVGLAAAGVVAVVPLPSLRADAPAVIPVLDPSPDFAREWKRHDFVRATEYAFAEIDDRPAVRAIGRMSASALYRAVEIDLDMHPWLEWSWRVEQLQPGADLTDTGKDDFAAGIMVLFERPGPFSFGAASLNYVWTTDRHPAGSAVKSPRGPDRSRHLVLRSGTGEIGRWIEERRNVAEDFRRVFGRAPPKRVRAVALFTDNDQTGEPVEACYGAIRAAAR